MQIKNIRVPKKYIIWTVIGVVILLTWYLIRTIPNWYENTFIPTEFESFTVEPSIKSAKQGVCLGNSPLSPSEQAWICIPIVNENAKKGVEKE